MVPEQNLLTGIFAVQLKYVTPQELAQASAQLALDQEQDICTILLEQGAITTRQAEVLRQLTEQQIKFHGGDVSAAMETFGGSSAIQHGFAASSIYEMETGVRCRSTGEDAPRVAEGTERLLLDSAQLNTEQPGRYTIRGEQGRGGVGRVLIAFDEQIGREIALKELLPDSAATRTPAADSPMRKTAALTARFLREARITGQLEHPGIVPVYELGQREDGNTYYTMKLVRGETLADRLRKCSNISDRLKLLPHFLDLCQAIAYAHSRGVIHRDIKPGNVMIGEFGETVLLDWGLAKVKGQEDEGAQKLADEIKLLKESGTSDTLAGNPIGTPSYMSPEQADGRIEDIDERSDVWNLGAVLYEILTGRPPFQGSTVEEVIGKVLSDSLTPVLAAQKDAPAELAAAAEKCLAREHRSRYLKVESLAIDINAFLSGGIVSAYTYSTGLLMKRWARRNWGVLGAAAGAFVVLVVAVLILVSQNNLLVNRQVELIARGLNASANSVRQYRSDGWQLGMLLALQARNFELNHFGIISSNTANTLREQLSDYPLGSKRLTGHAGAVWDVTYSPAGSLLASAGEDGTVRVWRVEDLVAEPNVLEGHKGAVRHITFNLDGSLLSSAGEDGTVRVWQVADLAAEPQVLKGHEGPVRHITFSPAGSLLASAGEDGTVRVWRVEDLTAEPNVLEGHKGAVRHITFNPDDSLLGLAGEDGTVRIWQVGDMGAEPRVLKGHEHEVLRLSFSPDGSLLASSSKDSTVRVWQVGNFAAEPLVLKGHILGLLAMLSVSFSPDGSLLASTDAGKAVRVWRVDDLINDPQVLRVFIDSDNSAVGEAVFSPDASLLVSNGDDGAVRVWQVNDLAAEPLVLKGHEGPVRQVSFSPDGSLLASAGIDGIVRVWPIDSLTTEPRVLNGLPISVWLADFSPDNSLLAAGFGGSIHVWQVDDLAAEPLVLKGHGGYLRQVTFSPDSRLLASISWDDAAIRVWQVGDLAAEPQILEVNEGELLAITFSPEGKLLGAMVGDGTFRFWQTDDLAAEPQLLKGHDGAVWRTYFSPDGRMLVSTGDEGTIHVWHTDDLTAEQLVFKGNEVDVLSVSFSPDCSLLAAAGKDATVRVWHVDDLAAEPQTLKGHEDTVWALSFSPDGRLLASWSADGTARVWQTDDLAAEPQVLRGIKGLVTKASFSPDGSVLASVDLGGTILVWQVDELGAKPQVLKEHKGVVWRIYFSPDGRLLASVGEDATVRVWQVDIGAIAARIKNECHRNLSWDEWQTYVGKSVPYEKTIPELPLGDGVPYVGAIAET